MNTDYRNLVAINDFRDPQEYIYNSDLVEFTQYGARLKDLIPTNVAVGATFATNYFLNYSNNSNFNTPFIYGSVTIEKERLALIGGQFNKQWTLPLMPKVGMGDTLPKGTIYFTYYPNYSETPRVSQHIFTFGQIPDEDNKRNLIEIEHTTTGDMLFNLYDKAGNQKQTNITEVVDYANTPIQFALCWDTETQPAQDQRVRFNIFKDGKSVVKYDLDVESFDINKVVEISFGNMIGSFKPNFAIQNLAILEDASLITEDSYELPENSIFPLPQTRYTTVPQKVEPLFHVDLEELKNVVTLTNNSDEVDRGFYVGYTFKVNGHEYYFDRTDLTWKEHKSPEQISDLGYMLAYKEQLLGSRDGVKFKCVPYLRTIKGNTSPEITSQTITYDQFVPYKEHVPTALIYGYVRDALGNFIKNAKVVVTPARSSVAETGNFILAKLTKAVRTGNNGYWDVQLPLSTNFVPEVLYNVQILYRDEVVYQRANLRVAKEGTIKFEDLIASTESGTVILPETKPSEEEVPENYIHGMVFEVIPDDTETITRG